MTNAQKTAMHYGWMIVLGGFFTQIALMISIQFVPIQLGSIAKDLSLNNAQAGTIISTFGLFFAGCSFIWGYVADKFGPRVAISLSGLILSVFVIVFGFSATSLTKAIVLIALVGFGAAGIYSATVPKLIGSWFHTSKRGRALGLINTGGAISAVILGALLPILGKAYGWKSATMIVGAIALVVVLIIFAIVRNHPSEKGLQAFGIPEGETMPPPPKEEKGQFGKVLKMGITWHIGAMMVFWQFAYISSAGFMVKAFLEGGVTPLQAGLSVSIYNLTSIIGMNLWGNLSDTKERKNILATALAVFAVFAALFVVVSGSSLATMYTMIGLMGIGMGLVPVILSIFSDYYPASCRGTGSGVISTLGLIGRVAGPMVAGMVADSTGSLVNAFVVSAIAAVIAGVIAYSLPKVRGRAQA